MNTEAKSKKKEGINCAVIYLVSCYLSFLWVDCSSAYFGPAVFPVRDRISICCESVGFAIIMSRH